MSGKSPEVPPGAAATRPLLWQGLLAAVLMALGFLVAIQLRAGRAFTGQEDVPTRNVYALAAMLRQERDARRDLEAQVAQLNGRLTGFATAAAQRKSAADALARELARLRIAAGLVPLVGPGIEVAMDDGKGAGGQTPPTVQYVDLVAIVNELWAAGAEAVAVSGVRVTARTGFSQVGGTIIADGRRLSPPYEVMAIGDPDVLDGALSIRGGVVEGLRALGLRITVTRRQQVTTPVGTVAILRVAQPASP